jgi:thiamine-monophosphate kinase
MKLSTIGEFGFIERIAPPLLAHLPHGTLGIGDDCAVIPWKENASLLVTTDMLVEDIHFLRAKIPAKDLGYKSLAVNLSDIAAMGGTPHSAFISIGIPANIEVEWLDEFYSGMRELAETECARILGGDTTKSPAHLVINITAIGTAEPRSIKYRSTAQAGDRLCVTDVLGDSGAGLRVLLEDKCTDDDSRYAVQRHHRPRAQIAEGAWLAAQQGVHAMMDVSDGIDSDIRRIMECSSCGAQICAQDLPVSQPLRRLSERFGWDIIELAATSGEDYCLLTTIAPQDYPAVAREFERKFNRPLTAIGVITEKGRGLEYLEDGKHTELKKHGYNHFA